MKSQDGYTIQWFPGFSGQLYARDEMGRSVPKEEVIGDSIAIETNHTIRICFVGIGDEADLEIGRMLAEATDGSSRRVSEKNVISAIKDLVK